MRRDFVENHIVSLLHFYVQLGEAYIDSELNCEVCNFQSDKFSDKEYEIYSSLRDLYRVFDIILTNLPETTALKDVVSALWFKKPGEQWNGNYLQLNRLAKKLSNEIFGILNNLKEAQRTPELGKIFEDLLEMRRNGETLEPMRERVENIPEEFLEFREHCRRLLDIHEMLSLVQNCISPFHHVKHAELQILYHYENVEAVPSLAILTKIKPCMWCLTLMRWFCLRFKTGLHVITFDRNTQVGAASSFDYKPLQSENLADENKNKIPFLAFSFRNYLHYDILWIKDFCSDSDLCFKCWDLYGLFFDNNGHVCPHKQHRSNYPRSYIFYETQCYYCCLCLPHVRTATEQFCPKCYPN